MGQVINLHTKYLERLAIIYLDKYKVLGYDGARRWYERTLDPVHMAAVRPYILEEAARRDIPMK